MLTTTPKIDGFRMPAEFEAQKQVFMLWPERPDVWHHNAEQAVKVFQEVAKAISRFTKVTVGVSATHFEQADKMISSFGRVVKMEHDDVWTRDVGPTFVINDKGQIRGIDWEFNAWGGLEEGAYYPWDLDNSVADSILKLENIESYKTKDFVLEGGSIHVDGKGTLLTTEECLLNSNRNPEISKKEIEDKLKDYLNVEKIIWLKKGLYNDETDGHIDNICCFAREAEVILAWTDDENSPNYSICREAYEILSKETDAKGRSFTIHKLYLPKPVYITKEEDEGLMHQDNAKSFSTEEPLPASYVNFLITNGGIILPVFKDEMDKRAIETLRAIFPKKQIIPVYSREIIIGGGNIHCITQQQPKWK